MQSSTPGAGKQPGVAAEGPAVTQPHSSVSRRCHFCLQEEGTDGRLQLCTGCSATVYCSKVCQKHHWQEHKALCKTVKLIEQHLAGEEARKNKLPEIAKVNYLSAKQGKKLIKLIGERKMVKCTFNNGPVTALWDTGAQATVIQK